ncbi:hypothetical protein C1646_761355 [Rhizophagus diaphanus]|nr:hypothetical protein C1646_761355 [Rhizophagus diaphanus] [Rhizophagus sp. MUCL 43196]
MLSVPRTRFQQAKNEVVTRFWIGLDNERVELEIKQIQNQFIVDRSISNNKARELIEEQKLDLNSKRELNNEPSFRKRPSEELTSTPPNKVVTSTPLTNVFLASSSQQQISVDLIKPIDVDRVKPIDSSLSLKDEKFLSDTDSEVVTSTPSSSQQQIPVIKSSACESDNNKTVSMKSLISMPFEKKKVYYHNLADEVLKSYQIHILPNHKLIYDNVDAMEFALSIMETAKKSQISKSPFSIGIIDIHNVECLKYLPQEFKEYIANQTQDTDDFIYFSEGRVINKFLSLIEAEFNAYVWTPMLRNAFLVKTDLRLKCGEVASKSYDKLKEILNIVTRGDPRLDGKVSTSKFLFEDTIVAMELARIKIPRVIECFSKEGHKRLSGTRIDLKSRLSDQGSIFHETVSLSLAVLKIQGGDLQGLMNDEMWCIIASEDPGNVGNMDKSHIEALAINIVSKANTLPSPSKNTNIPKVDSCSICRQDIYTLELAIIKVFTSCEHIFHQKCLEEYFVDKIAKPDSPKDVDNNDKVFTEESTNQKKCTREDSNESCEVPLGSTSTSSKKAKKTKKTVDQDQSTTLQRLIKELTTTEPVYESNNVSNIFLNLYNKIVAGEDQLKNSTQDVLCHYFDFGEAMKKRYDHYRSLKIEDLASQSLVDDDVQKQLPKSQHFRKSSSKKN